MVSISTKFYHLPSSPSLYLPRNSSKKCRVSTQEETFCHQKQKEPKHYSFSEEERPRSQDPKKTQENLGVERCKWVYLDSQKETKKPRDIASNNLSFLRSKTSSNTTLAPFKTLPFSFQN